MVLEFIRCLDDGTAPAGGAMMLEQPQLGEAIIGGIAPAGGAVMVEQPQLGGAMWMVEQPQLEEL